MNLIEKIGSGIGRIKKSCKDNGIRVRFDTEDFFIITLSRRTDVRKTTQKTTQKILGLIKDNPYITRKEIAELVGISDNGVKFHINNLKGKRFLKRIGPDRGGYWKVVSGK